MLQIRLLSIPSVKVLFPQLLKATVYNGGIINGSAANIVYFDQSLDGSTNDKIYYTRVILIFYFYPGIIGETFRGGGTA